MYVIDSEDYESLIKRFKDVLSVADVCESIEFTTYVEGDFWEHGESGSFEDRISISGNCKNFIIKSSDGLYESEVLNTKFEEKEKIINEIFKALNSELIHNTITRCIPLIDTLVCIKSVMPDDDETKQHMYESGKFIYSKLLDYLNEYKERDFDWWCEKCREGYGERFRKVRDFWGNPDKE